MRLIAARFAGRHPILLSSNPYSDRRIHLVVIEPRLLSLKPYCCRQTCITVIELVLLSTNSYRRLRTRIVVCEGVEPVLVPSTVRGAVVSRRRSVEDGRSP